MNNMLVQDAAARKAVFRWIWQQRSERAIGISGVPPISLPFEAVAQITGTPVDFHRIDAKLETLHQLQVARARRFRRPEKRAVALGSTAGRVLTLILKRLDVTSAAYDIMRASEEDPRVIRALQQEQLAVHAVYFQLRTVYRSLLIGTADQLQKRHERSCSMAKIRHGGLYCSTHALWKLLQAAHAAEREV